MGFLKNIFLKDNKIETIDTIPEQNITVPNDYHEGIIPQGSVPTATTSVNLMSKFLRGQRSSFSEPPETLHENEAWAPQTEFVGLFRKRRVNIKE
ncbi:MAG: hypothetical protein P4L69_16705 [Desulfosporosinus sp.]|nr:hypothetical protein [Desulfosporosinus sp.]